MGTTWSSATAQPEKLKLPAGTTQGSAIDVDEHGTVLGSVGGRQRQTDGISDDGRVITGYSAGPDLENNPLIWRCG